jgi:hypothetical protein
MNDEILLFIDDRVFRLLFGGRKSARIAFLKPFAGFPAVNTAPLSPESVAVKKEGLHAYI